MLRVEVRPSRAWPVLAFEVVMFTIFAVLAYQNWARMSLLFHAVLGLGLVSAIFGLVFQFSGVEILEIDTSKISLRKVVHGWERKREYEINRCRELQWMEGGEHTSGSLQFKSD